MKELLLNNKRHLGFFILSFVLVLASWSLAIYFWYKLPQQIPTNFNLEGQPNNWSDKSILSVFSIPFIQTLLFFSFLFLYWKPQYSDMPTTLWLMTMDKKIKDNAFGLIRMMLAVLSIWLGLLFTYLTYGIVASAANMAISFNPWIMTLILISMISWLVYWTVKVYKVTRSAIKTR